jgi:aminodeoxychorismate lyase
MDSAPIIASDRCFLYGDGLFETLRVVQGRVLWPALHLDRLMRGCERLGIPLSRQEAEAALEAHSGGDALLRLSVSRGAGPRGYAPPLTPVPIVRLSQHPAPAAADAPLNLIFSSVHLAAQPLLAGIKHCNRLEQVLAAAEARACGADEAILCGEDGLLQCAISANVFAVAGGTLITPPVDRAGVAGTRRRLILESLAPAAGLKAEEAPLSKADCLGADAVLLSNAGHGIRQASRLDGAEFATNNEVYLALQAAYRREVERCLAS